MNEKLPLVITVVACLIAGLMGYTTLRTEVDMLRVKVERSDKCQ